MGGLHAPDRRLAGADVDHVRIGGGDDDVADPRRVEVAVRDVLPGGAGVGGLPDSASGGTLEEGVGLVRDPGHGRHPSAPVGPDVPVGHGFEERRVDRLGVDRSGEDGDRPQDEGRKDEDLPLVAWCMEEGMKTIETTQVDPLAVRSHPDHEALAITLRERITGGAVVVTTDSAILDRCRQWTQLARGIIESGIADAWMIDLSEPQASRR